MSKYKDAAFILLTLVFFVWTASVVNRLDCNPLFSFTCSPRVLWHQLLDLVSLYHWLFG